MAFPLVAAGCAPRQVWGVPVDGLRADLAGARYGVLAAIDFASQSPDDAFALSPEAPFYLSFVFDSLDRPQQSLAMLELAWSRSPSPWKEEAGALLAERYNERKSFDRAFDTARRLLASSPSGMIARRVQRALVEALYWNAEDAAVLQEAARIANPDPEVLLFRAVSSLRLGLPAAHDLVMQLFLKVRVSPLHGRVYTFFTAEPSYLSLFTSTEQDLFAGKNALSQGSWAAGLAPLESVLSGIDPALVADGALVADVGNAYLSAAKYSAGASFLEKVSARLSGQARTDAREQAGRLYRRARDYAKAFALLRPIAEEAFTTTQRDRARWYILDMLFEQDPPDLAARVGTESASWHDPAYFSDVLQDRIAGLVSARRWSTLGSLRQALSDKGPRIVTAQLDYLLARAWQERIIARFPGTPSLTARELFTEAMRLDPGGYYGILSSSMLGEMPDRTVAGSPPPEVKDPVALDPLVMGFLPFGLSEQAYNRLLAQQGSLSDGQIMEGARRFGQAGDLRSAMYLTGALARRRRLTLDELAQFYPRGYKALIEPLASGAGIPDHLLYGLVREESYFDADIVSGAGAVGLSQLMPATAADAAKRLRLADPDLRDPASNLALGVRHLQDLLGNVDSTTKALLAYNAGLSRLRQWERAAPGLPGDLFIETVPIAETRGYVRKILISSVMYAFLYHDADPREAALSFFGIKTGVLEPDAQESRTGPAKSR